MFKPGTDEDNVQMSDVLCDFCHAEWTEGMALVEGHRGHVICGECLSLGYAKLVAGGDGTAPPDYQCTMCLEDGKDREALERSDEIGWQSPAYADAAICLRCLTQSCDALDDDPEIAWSKPEAG